jgi:signal transduction histidine kinase
MAAANPNPDTLQRQVAAITAPSWLEWLQPHSIRVRLSAIFALLFLLVISLGVFGIERLGDVNRASEEIRDHWLQDARILGDLNNYMSDYRTAEATRLLSNTPLELGASEKELMALAVTVARHQTDYERVAQDDEDRALYTLFAQQWQAYETIAENVLQLARVGRNTDAVVMYMTTSHHAFELASDTLGRLTNQTIAKAHAASASAASTYEHARTLIVIAMLFAGSILVGGIVYFTRSIFNPLLDLAKRMHALAQQDTDIFVPGADRGDEMGEMARSIEVFRDNAIALTNSRRRLIEQTANLDEALENEQRLTVKQRNFISMTSHEFRTPLTIIDGHAQRLIKISGRISAAEIAERGSRIRSAVLRMTSIMESLLEASRLLDGHGVFQPANLDPRALLHEACQTHREATRGTNIAEHYDRLPATVHGDSKLLFHAFSNLIANAVKYSGAGSPIELRAAEEAGQLVVRITDSGVGIPLRDREHLFERYFRGTNATGIAGTGVGLHFVAMVMMLHHGEVTAESVEGVGSTFIVRLPAARSALSEHDEAKRSFA